MNRTILNVTASTSSVPSAAKQFWEFKNSAVNDEATLYVYGDIVTYDLEDWNWPDDVVPNKFKNELNALGDVKTIHVRINSNGGSVFAAYAIMNLLKAHKAQIITYNDGIAASAATIIAMAGDKIVTALGSVWMVHLPSLMLWDNYNVNDLNKIVNALETISKSMVDIYNAKTGIDKAELEKMMNEDTWMTGAQAIEKGFADEITNTEVVAYLNTDKKTAFFNGLNVDIGKIRNKETLVSLLKEKPAADEAAASVAAPAPLAASPVFQQPPTTHPTTAPAMAPINKNDKEETIVDLNELKAKYPDIYNAALNEGIIQGTQNERNRIKEIDNMALPGMESLTNKAKYETGVTAGEFAVELIKAQKQKGVNFLNDTQSDAEHLNEVPAGRTPQNTGGQDEQEEQALLAKAKARAENLRR